MHANDVENYFLQFSFLDIRQIANIKNQSSEIDPKAPEGPFLILFQRDLLAAYQEIAPEITSNVMKYYVQHAPQWLSWKNVALSVYAEVPPYTVEATKTSTNLPQAIDVVYLLQNRSARLKHFFTQKNKDTPYIALSNINFTFWKSIGNHNRSTERRIEKLKNLVNERIIDTSQINHTDLRLRAHLCNMEK